ncbi:DUF559 domain-containing protein [Cyclobacterium sp. SYSU L10401]
MLVDRESDAILESYGIKVLRFSNSKLEEELMSVLKVIESFIIARLPER